jgi:hypothetical protein
MFIPEHIKPSLSLPKRSLLRPFTKFTLPVLVAASFLVLFITGSGSCSGLASNNIPLDSPIYLYLEKLAGLGLISGDIKGLRPYSKAEAARLVLEAEKNLDLVDGETLSFAEAIIKRMHDLIPRELSLYREPEQSQWLDFNPMAHAKLRYVYLDGVPRSFERYVSDPGHQSAFGFIGGDLRHDFAPILRQSGTEGTPLLENNEGTIYNRGHNGEFRFAMEAFLTSRIAMEAEPVLLNSPDNRDGGRSTRLFLNKGYVKLGGGEVELEVGRDANWFGPGYRGALSLTNNAKNFDFVKLSSPEPVDVKWIKRYLGDFKYSLIFSRFDETGTGGERREPYFLAMKIAVKPKPWFEIGGNFVRQEGGPGFSGSTSIKDLIFGGGDTNKSNSIAGFELRFRIPWLRNTELYGEYVGEDSALFWPFVESYIAGFFIPRLSASGKDDLRFEYFWGHQILYTDFKFPKGYTYHDMPAGHSQGGGSQEFFLRYSHWFSVRNNLALELIHTERGNQGRVSLNSAGEVDENGTRQSKEKKNAVRAFWNLPLYGDMDLNLMYGWEHIDNLNLVGGDDRNNQIFRLDISYRY